MDAGECFLASSGQDERSPWPLDLNLSLCPSATKDTRLLPPSPSPDSSSSASTTGGGYSAVSPSSSVLQPSLLASLSPLNPTYLPKLLPPTESNCKEEKEDEGEAFLGHVLFSSDGSVYLLKGEGEEEGALPSSDSPRDSPNSTVLPHPPLTSFRLTATYQGFRSNQISRHTSAKAADLTHTVPGTSPSNQDQPKEKEAGGRRGEEGKKHISIGESHRTQRVDGVWICLPCQLTFQNGGSLGRHALHFHELDHPYQDKLAGGETSGIVHSSSGQLFLSLLEPKKSHNVLEPGQEPENVVQNITLLDVIQTLPEQPGTSNDVTSKKNCKDTKSQDTCNPESKSQLSQGLVPNTPLKSNSCESTGTHHSTEAKDSIPHINEKIDGTTWCPRVKEAQGEGGEEEEEDEGECPLPTSQPSDITEQLLTNQSFYAQMMTSSFPQIGSLHGIDKRGDQTEADRGPQAHDDCAPTSGPQPFQSLSLQGQLSLLHSRNSCKTLKCPKCNWHYKYQQTLDVHMKEKHPESHSHCSYCHSGQQHPRLARGESYNCGYKPYRCEACNYSTTTKGNLTIHMQSDKHLANLQGYQGSGTSSNSSAPPMTAPSVNIGQVEGDQTSPPDRHIKQKASWHCKVCNYETNISRNLRIHMTSEKHMQNVLLLHQGLGMGQDTFSFYGGPIAPEQNLEHPLLFNPMTFNPSGSQACNLLTQDTSSGSQVTNLGSSSTSLSTPTPLQDSALSVLEEEPSSGVFRCLVCRCFTTDSLEGLISHASRGRSLPEREWREVRGDLHCCRLCSYSTQLKANFQLHLKTDKHAQKYQLAAHMREGGAALAAAQASAAELPISGYSQASSFPPLHIRCNLCGFESNSREKMQLHVQGGSHEETLRVYKFLQSIEGGAGSDTCFRCAPCESSVGSRLAMMSHLRSANHHQNLAQWRLTHGEVMLEGIISICRNPPKEPAKVQTSPESVSNQEADEESTDVAQASTQEETSRSECDNTTEGTTVFCCPFCAYVSPSEEHVRSHTVSQHALQPTFRCPLCQEKLTGTANLRSHLGHGHNVVSECVEKLLQVAQKVDISFRTRIIPLRIRDEPEHPVLETRPTCEATNLVNEVSPPQSPCDDSSNPADISEPVLEPEKTPDETSCPFCRQTPEDLRTHLEKDHPELNPSDIQQACEARHRETEGGEAEDRKCSQENTPVHSQQATYRKTTNFAMDKFMDPSRPHKCVVCKESFTQKNILLVHYNSVSHLHKVRKASLDPSLSARQEPGAGTSGHGIQTGQDKPYKCTVCHVSYNQSSTLEIHMRSVLHQTRSRGTKQDISRVPQEKPQREGFCRSENTSDPRAETAGELQNVEASKKRIPQISSCLGVPILPANVASSTVQLAIDLPHPPPLVQPPPLFAPSLLPSFPLIPEALLKLQRQQQQLLLPFYLQELKVSGDGGNAPLLSFSGAQLPQPTKDEGGQPSVTPKPANDKEERVPDEQDAATAETDASQNPESRTEAATKAGDLTGSAARALLENFGFELVTQYNEGRQPSTCQPQIQPRPPAPPPDVPPAPTSADKLQCGTCGKHFSNRLILKTHEEHMHQRLLPFEALSRYAAHYRRNYDSHYPTGLSTETGESSLAPLDFSITSKGSQEAEEQDATCEMGFTVEQLSFLHSLLDLPNHSIEEQILWAADKSGLSPAAVQQWYKQREKVFLEGQEDEGEETSRGDRLGNRRFSRTKFSDFQTQALNSFFEASAYPRDSEVEHLSGLLGLPGRVIVVWFQNARQKARKQAAETGTTPTSPLHSNPSGERPASNSKVPPCRKCGVILPCIFQLIRHLKGCYNEQNDELTEEEMKEEETNKIPKAEGSQPDQITTSELISGNTQDEEQDEVLEEDEIEPPDTTAPETKETTETESPTGNDDTIQQTSEQNEQPIEQNETFVPDKPLDQSPNKSASNSGQPMPPLMDLSLFIPLGHGDVSCQRKRKHEEESLSPTGSEGGDEPPRDKRLRTTILPEQLDILHRWYLQDSNPTRSTLERISLEVGLKKRVVQVWFQNTRARERKGQYRGVAPASATRQQDDAVPEGSKRDVPTSYYYSVGTNQVAPPLPTKTAHSTSSLLSKTPSSSGQAPNTITNKSLVNTTQALTGLLNANQVLPSLVTQPQAIPGLATTTQALTNLVSTPQALSSFVNPTQAFPSLVNPAQVLSSIVNTNQASSSLLLASFTAKAPAPPILLSTAPEVKPNTSSGLLVSSVEKIPEHEKISALPTPSKNTADPQIYHQPSDAQICENQSGNNPKIPEDRGSSKTVEAQMHSPLGGDISDDSGSDLGPTSPGKSGINSEGMLGSSGARRYRTQMSSLQLRILKACYSEYRTPSMQECDCLGGEIGLQKRVVQVWFQNARAKEKKARLQGLGGTSSTGEGPQPTECTHCNVKYGPTTPCRAHIFSRQHIARLRMSIQQQLKEESRYRDTQPTGGAASGSENKQASQLPSFPAPNTVTPQIQRLTPLLMPGQGIPTPIGGLATFNAGPPPSLLGMASSVSPALLPRTAPPAPSASHSSNDASVDSSQATLTPEASGTSALKTAPLMGAPFMPFPLAPAATPLFTPQIQGPYFQQLYGLKKRLFPINPVIPHTLLGLLPTPLKPTAETAPPRKLECPQTKATNECNVGQEEMLMVEEETVEKDDDLDDDDIPMVDVAMRYQCQRCKASYEEEAEAEAHQRAVCYTGPPPHPPPLRMRVCTYHCLSCQVLLQGSAARSQHLRSQQHRVHNMCGDGASSAIPQLRPKSAATSVLMAL
ncbi:zinc finger homeobox protein 2 [Pelobates fuscus]|uniref:zinc finger homeobox protein 2 n=1 Tax=Pelobates fuscus TaxID=191477 RepID=UPI002FE4CB85